MATLSFPTQAARLDNAATAMLKANRPAIEWKPVDVDTMPADLRKLYDAYKAAQQIASTARLAFEDHACTRIGQLLGAKAGQDVAFGYKFGKLSVALTDKSAPRSAANALRF